MVWDAVEPMLARCLARNVDGYGTAEALENIKARDSFVLVCEIDDVLRCVCLIDWHPDSLHVRTWTGDGRDDWFRQMIDTINKIARVTGRHYVTSISRPGAAKVLKAEGWKVKDYFLVHEVAA